jgi:hypothetical protein
VITREQAVRNSLLIREVNERIADLSDSWLDGEPREFLCECGDESCIEVILVPRADYQVVREHSGRYLITSDHGDDAGTKARRTRDGYSIVEYRAIPEANERIARTSSPHA